jgi:uncharacterized protein (TIGR01777 family)
MKVFLTGGSGFIGKRLVERLHESGHHCIVLSRSLQKSRLSFPGGTEVVEGDPTIDGAWTAQLQQADLVINLVGESVFGRWNEKRKDEIRRTRIESTRNIVRAIASSQQQISLINASAVGFYGMHPHQTMTEKSPAGRDFLAQVCKEWEAAANLAAQYNCRVATIRIGIVLHPSGGALKQMLPIFKSGLGGWQGSGRQWMSWIHREDLIELIVRVAENPTARGAFNAVSPHPVTNRQLCEALARQLKRPCVLPVPGFVLKAALGEAASLLTEGQRVICARAKEVGFNPRFQDIESCLKDLITPG